MRPEKLLLRNIGPFAGLHTIDFNALGSLFLIHGKTGAGKTTIFDAICYVLYGQIPGARKGLNRHLRSQYAGEGEESSVCLEFLLGSGRWQVIRVLPREYTKRTGSTGEKEEEVTLSEYKHGAWHDCGIGKKSEVDRYIQDLIGLSVEEFSRIIMLPQGQFADFLRQNSNERKEVLAKLFPIDQYNRVIDYAREKTRTATAELAALEKRLEDLDDQWNTINTEGGYEELVATASACRHERDELQNQLSELSVQREKARAARLSAIELERCQSQLAALQKEEPAKRMDAERLERCERAEPLHQRLREVHAKTEEASRLKKELTDGRMDEERLQKELDDLTLRQNEIDERVALKARLIRRRDRLQIAVRIAADMAHDAAILTEHKAAKKTAHAAVASRKKNLDLINERLSCLPADPDELKRAGEQNEHCQRELDAARTLKTACESITLRQRALEAHRKDLLQLELKAKNLSDDFSLARAEITEMEAERETLLRTETAAGLAAVLQPGTACPVCGSTEHPNPARSISSDWSIDERLAAKKRSLELISEKQRELGQSIERRRADIASAGQAIQELCAPLGLEALPDCASVEEQLKNAIGKKEEASINLQRLQKAFTEARKLEDGRRNEETALREEEAALARATQQLALTEASLADKQKRYKDELAQDRETDEEPETTDIEDALEQCASRLQETEAVIHRWQQDMADRKEKLSALRSRLERVADLLRETTTSCEEREQELLNACIKAGFTGTDDLAGALMESAERDSLKESLRIYERETASVAALCNKLHAEQASWQGPDESALSARIKDMQEQMTATNARLEELSAAIQSWTRLRDDRAAAEEERKNRAAEATVLNAVANDLTGKNPLSRSFDAWILGACLEEITAYANQRLEQMSDGRFRLKMNEDWRKGNAKTGLELEIVDAWTGQCRPSGTLSGGETFMTSISLALGLADSIQARSGGVQLDAVFIDEGFGSLDETSLEKAVCLLDEIRGQRLVGIISHVAELRSRIPDRIEIIKTGSGSRIKQGGAS